VLGRLLRDPCEQRRPVPQTAQKLVITSGKDQGKRPSVATVYRILAGDADSIA
jgi:hypothetical protein